MLFPAFWIAQIVVISSPVRHRIVYPTLYDIIISDLLKKARSQGIESHGKCIYQRYCVNCSFNNLGVFSND